MRSPASPRSATSFKSPVPISRPSGILPGVNVFHVPPPAVDARAPPACSEGALGDGETGCAGAVEVVPASATAAGVLADGADAGGTTSGAGGDAAAPAGEIGPTGNARFATIVGAGLAGGGDREGACAMPFCLAASFPRLDDGPALASCSPFPGGCTTGGVATGFAASTRTNSFAAGAGAGPASPGIGTGPRSPVSRCRYSA